MEAGQHFVIVERQALRRGATISARHHRGLDRLNVAGPSLLDAGQDQAPLSYQEEELALLRRKMGEQEFHECLSAYSCEDAP
jgi:hypothetical protein